MKFRSILLFTLSLSLFGAVFFASPKTSEANGILIVTPRSGCNQGYHFDWSSRPPPLGVGSFVWGNNHTGFNRILNQGLGAPGSTSFDSDNNGGAYTSGAIWTFTLVQGATTIDSVTVTIPNCTPPPVASSLTLNPIQFQSCSSPGQAVARITWSYTGNPGTLSIFRQEYSLGSPNPNYFIGSANPNQAGFSDSGGMLLDHRYIYTIRSGAGTSNPAQITIPSTNCNPPAPVQGFTGSSFCQGSPSSPWNRLSWQPTPNANYYFIYRDRQWIGQVNSSAFLPASATNDTAPTAGTNYAYGISVNTASGFSPLVEVSVSTTTCAPPPPPPPLPGTPTLDGVAGCSATNQSENVLNWNDPGNASSYILYRNSIAQPGTTLRTYLDSLPGDPTSYQVRAVNRAGVSLLSNIKSLSNINCAPPPPPPPIVRTPSLIISGLSSVLFDSNNQYTATVLDPSNGQSIPLADYDIEWLLLPVNGNLVGTLVEDNTQPKIYKTLKTILRDCLINGKSSDLTAHVIFHSNTLWNNASAIMRVTLVDSCSLSVLGDLFGKLLVKGLNVGSNSVVSSTGEINLIDRQNNSLSIQYYNPSNKLVWGTFQINTSKVISRLISEQAQSLPQNINSSFPLNSNGSANPEGKVWYTPGNLVINGPIAFSGRGTLIAQGSVTINGAVSYQDPKTDMLGIISRTGNINISSQLAQGVSVVGAYFAPDGEIKFGSNITSATGLFVGNTISIDSSLTSLRIIYDGRITKNPLPGFGQSFVPLLGETAP